MELQLKSRGNGLHKPVGVFDIIVRRACDEELPRLRIELFDLLRRCAAVYPSGFEDAVFKHYCTCCNEYMFFYDGEIHYDCAHPDQHLVVYGASVHDGIVTDRYIIADDRLRFLIGAVQHRPVLDIDAMPDADCIDIAADDCIPPHAAIIAHDDIAYDDRGVCEVAVASELGCFVVECFNDRHSLKIGNRQLAIGKFKS